LLGDRIAVRQFCREQNRLSSRQPSGSGSSSSAHYASYKWYGAYGSTYS